MALEQHVLLAERQLGARGDADLLVDQVNAGDHLRHRMLHLQAGVHLDEVELAVLVEELDRADAAVLQLAHGIGDDLADLLALRRVERGGGSLLQDFLVAALQRAVAFAQMDRVAPAVAQHLDLDVARLAEILLHVERIVAEGGLGFRAGRRQRGVEVLLGQRHLHAASAAAGSGLDQHRVADLAGDRVGVVRRLHRAVGARNHRDAQLHRRLLGGDLVAHDADVLGRRADESDVVRLEDLGEAGVFRQEAVARMHRIGAGDLAGGQQLRNVEVAVARGRRADADALVGKAHMHGIGIGGRVHGHRLDAKLLARAQHPQRDLAAIGDQDLGEHGLAPRHSMTTRGSPYSTGWPSSTKIAVTRPARGAGIWFMVFIASTMSSVSPAATVSPISTKVRAPGSGER